ncbi:uncharacterized protein EV154DRAFT_181128 [Mucor mucedo]|uniref:uncharacterized protein n=1 Tax=Mucor mucedo TaxID=29922 RepID=UPI002220B981|nr:uncharacterized protein EV154DRAFT_181128 [Mucor mucedo]KAI7864546.1 hypothetical protein EV154DRAFT_181128 [Mucor mucedo]
MLWLSLPALSVLPKKTMASQKWKLWLLLGNRDVCSLSHRHTYHYGNWSSSPLILAEQKHGLTWSIRSMGS